MSSTRWVLPKVARAIQPSITLCAVIILAVPAGGCFRSSPRMQAPFTLSNASERHPIRVEQGDKLLELSVSSHSHGLSQAQWDRLYGYLADYREHANGPLVIKTPTGSANAKAAKRAYEDVRHAMYRSGISPRAVRVKPYSAKGSPAAPLQLSYQEIVAKGPDCPDWSENIGRDPQNLPWPNMGCATQKNLAAMVADPRDFLYPRYETPRPGERRDVVWGKYVQGEPTISKRAPSEHAAASDIDRIGASN